MKIPLRVVLTIAATVVLLMAGMLLHKYRHAGGHRGEAPSVSPQEVQAKVRAQEIEVDRCGAEVQEIARKYNIFEITPLPEGHSYNPYIIACGPGTIEDLRRHVKTLETSLRQAEDAPRLLESIRKQLEDSRKYLAEREAQSRVLNREQSEYAAAKQRYEASLALLNRLKGQAAREASGQAIPAKN